MHKFEDKIIKARKQHRCDLCGSIDAEDYACRNCFEEGRTYSNVNFENRINIP